jgi:dTDP-4-dehydrorhamnose 3,5-epimerase-like enzyme
MLWCITHTAKYYTPRKYFHQFVVLEKDTYKPIKYSIPFYFNYYQIEYTLGFIIKNNKANIIFSQNDSQPCLLQVDMNKLSDMMIDI